MIYKQKMWSQKPQILRCQSSPRTSRRYSMVASSATFASREPLNRLSSLQHAESVQIIGQVSDFDFRFHPDQANRSDDQCPDPHGLRSKNMFHPGDFWKEQPPEYREFGLCFCDVDPKLAPRVDPRLTLQRPQTIYSIDGSKTCEYCKFVLRINE